MTDLYTALRNRFEPPREQYPDATDIVIARVTHASIRAHYGALADALADALDPSGPHPLPAFRLQAPEVPA